MAYVPGTPVQVAKGVPGIYFFRPEAATSTLFSFRRPHNKSTSYTSARVS